MLLLTLRGTPTIYQGEEIGMLDVPISASLVQDPFERNVPGFGLGRDPVRTPMPWTAERHGGFTEGEPWLPVNADVESLNVSQQADDPHSMLSLYRRLIRLRKDYDVLSSGDFRLVGATEHVLAYERRLGDRQILVALNLTDQARMLETGEAARTVLLSTYLDDLNPLIDDVINLRANEGLVFASSSNLP